ncbi:hypothetical protein HOK68_04330 [Candidatus Woesearchaeota archaeon]|jgi:hypothetical protein|nr:hypothetical protein [Candidatus Woesearchaeota archaeon]MBT4387256.1 hypothetical protein [Candidatus Woesearchaeota archaeon]MBT4596257.1 hypothetical protein [Candidatus Woesearchaeota archaeon]MBT5741520.1 hypothetical protein [Candidatus Woesearchaeota archaeon]MBT6505978.1 hypothetical protein [Candidatus Woesearchaeota archaeon]
MSDQKFVKLGFNNKKFLTGCLENTRCSFQKDTFRRLSVGDQGGLFYSLFKHDDWRQIPHLKISTNETIASLEEYVKGLKDYMGVANQFVKDNSVLSLYELTAGIFVPFVDNSDYYFSAIGRGSFESLGDVEHFLTLILNNEQKFMDGYGAVMSSLEKYKKLLPD